MIKKTLHQNHHLSSPQHHTNLTTSPQHHPRIHHVIKKINKPKINKQTNGDTLSVHNNTSEQHLIGNHHLNQQTSANSTLQLANNNNNNSTGSQPKRKIIKKIRVVKRLKKPQVNKLAHNNNNDTLIATIIPLSTNINLVDTNKTKEIMPPQTSLQHKKFNHHNRLIHNKTPSMQSMQPAVTTTQATDTSKVPSVPNVVQNVLPPPPPPPPAQTTDVANSAAPTLAPVEVTPELVPTPSATPMVVDQQQQRATTLAPSIENPLMVTTSDSPLSEAAISYEPVISSNTTASINNHHLQSDDESNNQSSGTFEYSQPNKSFSTMYNVNFQKGGKIIHKADSSGLQTTTKTLDELADLSGTPPPMSKDVIEWMARERLARKNSDLEWRRDLQAMRKDLMNNRETGANRHLRLATLRDASMMREFYNFDLNERLIDSEVSS